MSGAGSCGTSTTLEYGEREEEAAEQLQEDDAEDDQADETQQLREQVALLLRSLEEEKKRRTSEQKLMQEKILELQSVIRRNLPEHQRELEQRVQRAPAPLVPQPRCLDRRCQPPSDDEDTDDVDSVDAERGSDASQLRWSDIGSQSTRSDSVEDDRVVGLKMRQQLTLMRAKMHATVLDAQREAQALRQQLKEEQAAFERKQRQWRVETTTRLAALEEKHMGIRKRLMAKTASLSQQVETLTDENRRLNTELAKRDERIQQLGLALNGRRRIVGDNEVAPSSPSCQR
ncbi:hypothetical protein PINS_up011224 [Pythium insidiosum]|nr:hypothetical protein PINS_up011224 [Pythium insidiosum]